MKARALASIFLALILLSNVATVNALTVSDALYYTSMVTPFGFIYYLFKDFSNFLEHYYELENISNWTYMQTKTDLLVHGAEYTNSMSNFETIAEYVKYYALARAKAVYVEELANGADPNTAMNKAIQVAEETIDNATKNLIEFQNMTVVYLEQALPHYKQVCDAEGMQYNISYYPDHWVDGYGNWHYYAWYQVHNITINYRGYSYKKLVIDNNHNKEVDFIRLEGVELYNHTRFYAILDKLISEKEWIANNLANYFIQVNQLNLNVSEVANKVLDPYAILTMAQNNSTNYYAWSEYQLALLGLATNLTAPVTLEIENTTYSGYLFVSDGFNSTLTVNSTYTVPDGESVYLLTQDGKIIVLESGDTFSLLKATDEKTGQELQTITLTKYTDSTLEATKILEDVEKLIELYNLTLQKTTTTVGGGGSGGSDWADSINNFWNSLDWQVKALIIGGGILTGIVLIGRSFGRGGVSVLKVEEPK